MSRIATHLPTDRASDASIPGHGGRRNTCLGLALLATLAAGASLRAQEDGPPERPAGPGRTLRWRAVGPAVMSGRIVEIAVPPQDPAVIYAAASTGGLWKTTNRGTTWTPVFDGESTLNIGTVAVAPSDPGRVWVGTGEANNQRSSYAGKGVWSSADAGKTWAFAGLPDSGHVGRIAIHPTEPDTVFVAALGHLYSANAERGLYRTKDGGKTWEHVLKIDADTGVVDVVIDPTRPETVYAASYQRRRRAWNFGESGPGSGIWKSTDGGTVFRRLEGGLPKGEIGRIGLALSARNPDTLFACVENRNPAEEGAPATDDAPTERDADPKDAVAGTAEEVEEEGSPEPEPAEAGAATAAAAPPKLAGGEVWRTDDAGGRWRRVNAKPVSGEPAYYYGQIRIDPTDDDRIWLPGVPLFRSEDGGKTWKNDGARGIHSDHHALWIDPSDPDHMLDGNDGGLAVTWDRGETWDVFPNLPLAQFYTVCVDNRRPYRIYGGLQDNGTFGVPSVGAMRTGIQDWEGVRVGGGDGFCCAVDPEDPDIVYSESQFGRPSRLDLRTWKRTSIRPPRGRGEPALRCNWMSPLVISPHNARTLYFGSQRIHRSLDRGDTWEAISPDLTANDAEKIKGNVPHCTITTISESPLRAGVIWAGTDDGKVQVTQDGARHWRDVTDHFPAEVRGLWVSRVAASAHERGRAYVAFTGYREDRFEPWILVTEDYGGTWARITGGLPESPVNTVLEDPANATLLYAGTETGVWSTSDGGESWEPLGERMPVLPVHDLALQARDGDLVAATHGRGMWVLHVEPLRQLTAKALEEPFFLCRPSTPAVPGNAGSRGFRGARFHEAPNPRAGLVIAYHLKTKAEGDVSLEVRTVDGRRVRALEPETEPGGGGGSRRGNGGESG